MSEKPVECLHTHVSQASACYQYCEDLTNPQRGGPKEDNDYLRVTTHAVVRAVIQGDDGIKLQVDVVGLDLTALIDTRQVVE